MFKKIVIDTPKSDKSRTVDVGAATIAALLAMRERQTAEPVQVGKVVFRRPTAEGFPTLAARLNDARVPAALDRGQVRRMPFHHLRHCCATWLLSDGMDVVAVSKRLGHWSPALTLRICAHSIPGRQQLLARAIGDALR